MIKIECLKRDDTCEGFAFNADEVDSCVLVDDSSSGTHEEATGWTLYAKKSR